MRRTSWALISTEFVNSIEGEAEWASFLSALKESKKCQKEKFAGDATTIANGGESANVLFNLQSERKNR